METAASRHDEMVIKSPNDQRSYRLLRLANGLCALLIHDPEIYADGYPDPHVPKPHEDEDMDEDDEDDEEDDEECSDEEEDEDDDGEGDDDEEDGSEPKRRKQKGGTEPPVKKVAMGFALIPPSLCHELVWLRY
jgi:nardilysin